MFICIRYFVMAFWLDLINVIICKEFLSIAFYDGYLLDILHPRNNTLKHCLPIGNTLKDSLLQPFSKTSLKTDSSLLRPINYASKDKLIYALQD